MIVPPFVIVLTGNRRLKRPSKPAETNPGAIARARVNDILALLPESSKDELADIQAEVDRIGVPLQNARVKFSGPRAMSS